MQDRGHRHGRGAPQRAKWKAGLAEMHGAIAKLMLLRRNETVFLMHDWEVHIAVTCVFSAKHRLHRSAGWAPAQIVFGSDVGLGNGVVEQLATGRIKHCANELGSESTQFQRTQVIRHAAAGSEQRRDTQLDAHMWIWTHDAWRLPCRSSRGFSRDPRRPRLLTWPRRRRRLPLSLDRRDKLGELRAVLDAEVTPPPP